MLRPLVGCCALVLFAGGAGAQEKPPADAAALREAAGKAIGVIQKSQRVWYEKGAACISCHHQNLPILVSAAAAGRGVAFDSAFAGEVAARTFAYVRDLDGAVQGPMYIDDIDEATRLVVGHAAGVPASASTSAAAQALAATQRADGSWHTIDSRPPQSYGRITTTALAARAVALAFPESLADRKQAVLRRAREWLLKANPRATEERAYHLLGLLWTGAGEADRKRAAQALRDEQRPDGGWAQIPGLGSDAYSTGEALTALHRAGGLATDDPVYRKGLAFLLTTQAADGSWRVESRLTRAFNPSPEYFNAGFPHGRDHQYISIMGTAAAALALLDAVPETPGGPKPAKLDVRPAETDKWIDAALNGTAADLAAALDKGMSPNAKTARGTTALMFAARDPEKVKLLLARGADATARAESGFTALTVAARAHGNVESVRILLKAGAKPNAPKGAPAQFGATPLFFAAAVGDVESARALLDAGAAQEPMKVLDMFLWTPLIAATLRGDAAMVELLVRKGAEPDGGRPDGTTPLHMAVLCNHPETVKVLLANGAKVNAADDLGLTALHYAAGAPFEDPTVTDLLLAAGADRTAKDKKGRTPRDLATELKHPAVAATLAKTASRR